MQIYLDNNSTSPVLPEVAAAMAECYAAGYANPESQHFAGRRARQALEQAREDIGRMVGADMLGRTPDRVIFTSGGTESNNLALLGLAAAAEAQSRGPREAIISSIEHPSILEPAKMLERRGWTVHRLSVDHEGIASAEQLRTLLNDRTRFVSVMLANNETGIIEPVRELAQLCMDKVVPLHTDAVQAIGRIEVNFRELGVAAMTIAAHKSHGPRGIGALVLRHDLQIEPQLFGGFQQGGLRPGTESVALAVGMKTSLEQSRERWKAWQADKLRERFESALQAELPQIVINAAGVERLPNTSNIAFVGRDRQELLIALDLAGIACSTGSACASGSSEPSHVLQAMGLSRDAVTGSLRFSFGVATTIAEIDETVRRIVRVLQQPLPDPHHKGDGTRQGSH